MLYKAIAILLASLLLSCGHAERGAVHLTDTQDPATKRAMKIEDYAKWCWDLANAGDSPKVRQDIVDTATERLTELRAVWPPEELAAYHAASEELLETILEVMKEQDNLPQDEWSVGIQIFNAAQQVVDIERQLPDYLPPVSAEGCGIG